MHGFNNGVSALLDLCSFGDIIAVEEHWLAPHNFDKLMNVHSDFQVFCWSPMDDTLKAGFLVGRPFGGLGLLVRKNLNDCSIRCFR